MKSPTTSTLSLLIVVSACLTETALARNPQIDVASPLQSLTLWDDRKSTGEASPRAKFLPRYEAGVEAEFKAEELIQAKFQQAMDKLDKDDILWPRKAALLEKKRLARLEKASAAAYDKAMAKYDASLENKNSNRKKNSKGDDDNKYQFVGVVVKNGRNKGQPVQWYARKKPRGAKWSLRMLHVNKDAILKDLYDQGRLDIEAKYKNAGDGQVKAMYKAKERSWKTLWNFSPVAFFTDSSGTFWRERRLQEGVFTDGKDVYESRYRYTDGRNGMYHTKQSLEKYMRKNKFGRTKVEATLRKVKDGKPDVVIECPIKVETDDDEDDANMGAM